jgi:DNA-binding transcriptional MerR regulator
MENHDRWPYGKPPVAGTVQAAPLSHRQIAELREYRDLFNKHQEQLEAEGRETDGGLAWRVQVNSDFSDMSADRRAEVEEEIEELRSDPEVRESLRRRLEETKPELLPYLDESE